MRHATRAAYGETLSELLEEGARLVAVEADLGASTTLSRLESVFPNRYFNVGIAEQDMIGTAVGLALAGWVTFTGSFAAFGVGRCYDQIRASVCHVGANVKICPTHAGITVGPDGATHQMLEDIGMMRALPGMRVLVPSDYHSAKAAIRLAYTTEGPVYVRLGRHPVPDLYSGNFEASLPMAVTLREGSDVTLLACGVEVHQALLAADALRREGVSAEVLDVFTVTPLDEDAILSSVSKTGHVVTCEEHMVCCGMGSAVAEILSTRMPTPMAMVGMHSFGRSGSADELLESYELNSAAIVKATRGLLERTKTNTFSVACRN